MFPKAETLETRANFVHASIKEKKVVLPRVDNFIVNLFWKVINKILKLLILEGIKLIIKK